MTALSKDFIKGYYLDDLNICDRFIDFFNNNKELHGAGFIYGSEFKIDRSQKESTDINLSIIDDRNKCDVLIDYEKELIKALDKYKKEFPSIEYGSRWGIFEQLNIQYYKPGQGFKRWHCERSQPKNDRMLVWMTYLNDVDDGGTEFENQKFSSPAKKGLTLFWPADWTYTHRGIISYTKEKYIVTGWFSYA